MEYNNRYSNDNPKEIKINNINNNFLFFRSKDFSDKIKLNQNLLFNCGNSKFNTNNIIINNVKTESNETRAKLFNQDIQKNIYIKAKGNYEFLIKKNMNIFMINKKGGKFP